MGPKLQVRVLFSIVVVCVLASLSGCAGIAFFKKAAPSAPSSWTEKQTRLLALDQWKLHARIGLKLGEKAMSATLKWQQQQQDYRLLLIAPFGKGTVELYSQDGTVSLRTHDNQLLSAVSPEHLLEQHFGWSLPVGMLSYWIRGIPQPDVAIDSIVFDGQQRIRRLQQAQWDITYSRYGQVGEYALPDKIKIENARIRIKVTLAIKEWDLQ